MARCRADKSIERRIISGFEFPLGVYPVEDMSPQEGFTSDFEPADGDDEEGEWEEWPDRYVFEIAVSFPRLEPLCRSLFALLPGRVYPILDVLGNDAYREVDPFIAYDRVGLERFLDCLRRFKTFFFEDGMVGFGAMSDEPFISVFIDEHKILTVRAETALKERIENVLHAFDLEATEKLAGVDSATHEHRGVLEAPGDRPDLVTADEIIETLRDEWDLTLNIDPETNLDDEGHELGITGWRCLVRWAPEGAEPPFRYIEVLLTAANLREAEDLALEAAMDLAEDPKPEGDPDALVVVVDRMLEADFKKAVREAINAEADLSESRSFAVRRLD